MKLKNIKIGTRGSKLALIQAQLVSDELKALSPDLEVELVTIKTEGDRNFAPIPLDTVGKEWFTAEIDRALVAGEIDIAVHSLKDLPADIDPRLTLTTVLTREDPSDVLISKSGGKLSDLPTGANIGTDSVRRKALLLRLRPDLKVSSLRGNVITRLKKLEEGDYDAIILAAAGLARLGELDRATEIFDPKAFIPSVGQGTLAVEFKQGNSDIMSLLAKITDNDTATAAAAERSFSATVGGGCKMPIGCYANVEGDTIHLYAFVATIDSDKIHFDTSSGPTKSANDIAQKLAETMLSTCGFELPAI